MNEEEQNPVIKTHKFKFKKNLKKNNYLNNGKNILDNNEKEARSEYEHFLDREDYWSNKSSTSYSCKSGFTVTRKLRSLNRERDKIKMMNNLKNLEKNNIDKIEDKLINIVNKFHKDNSLNKINKKRKSTNIIKLKNGDNVIVDTEQGPQFATVIKTNNDISEIILPKKIFFYFRYSKMIIEF